jgi:hypothetical protein
VDIPPCRSSVPLATPRQAFTYNGCGNYDVKTKAAQNGYCNNNFGVMESIKVGVSSSYGFSNANSRKQQHRGQESDDVDDLLNFIDSADNGNESEIWKSSSLSSTLGTSSVVKSAQNSSDTMQAVGLANRSSRRCGTVCLAGTIKSKGFAPTSGGSTACGNIRCTKCDFAVKRFDNYKVSANFLHQATIRSLSNVCIRRTKIATI